MCINIFLAWIWLQYLFIGFKKYVNNSTIKISPKLPGEIVASVDIIIFILLL